MTMKQELLAQVDRWYNPRCLATTERKKFLAFVQGIQFVDTANKGIHDDGQGLFVIENSTNFDSLLGLEAFKVRCQKDQNIWIICLDPLDILVIVKNEADRIFIEEESENNIFQIQDMKFLLTLILRSYRWHDRH